MNHIPKLIATSACGTFFYCFGYMLKEKENLLWVFILAIIVYVSCIVSREYSFVAMFDNSLRSGYYVVWLVGSLCGIIVLNNICKYLRKIYQFPILNHIGKNAMNYYVTHQWILFIVGWCLLYGFKISTWQYIYYGQILSCVIVLPLLNRILIRLKK